MESTIKALTPLSLCILTDAGAALYGPWGVVCPLSLGDFEQQTFQLKSSPDLLALSYLKFSLITLYFKTSESPSCNIMLNECKLLSPTCREYYVLKVYQLVPGILHI